jgi:uncharacterized protein (TIGR02449 family)
MDDVFNRLKVKIYALMTQCDSLQAANDRLKQTTSLLLREKEILQAKHEDTISQIETMVSRLKLLEKPQ